LMQLVMHALYNTSIPSGSVLATTVALLLKYCKEYK